MSSESIESFKKRLKGCKKYCGSPICQRCGLPIAGMKGMTDPVIYKYGCECVTSSWKDTFEEAQADYERKMKELEKED